MKPVHAILAAAFAAFAIFLPATFAQVAHGHDHMAMHAPAAPQAATVGGEVRKIDLETRKLTVKHDASRDMNMPAMTMVYPVADAALLTKVKVGEKVRFRTASVGGKMTVTDILPAH